MYTWPLIYRKWPSPTLLHACPIPPTLSPGGILARGALRGSFQHMHIDLEKLKQSRYRSMAVAFFFAISRDLTFCPLLCYFRLYTWKQDMFLPFNGTPINKCSMTVFTPPKCFYYLSPCHSWQNSNCRFSTDLASKSSYLTSKIFF